MRDLIEHSGDNYVDQILKRGLFTVASARINGEPLALPTTPEMEVLIEKVKGGIEAGEIGQPSDLIITLSAQELRNMLSYIVKPFNFLKHADRDPLDTLDESDVDPHGTIIHALNALTMVCPDKALPETIKPYLVRRDLS